MENTQCQGTAAKVTRSYRGNNFSAVKLTNLNMNNKYAVYEYDDQLWTTAMGKCDLNEMQRLLAKRPDFVHIHEPCTGYTALHLAVQSDREDIIDFLTRNYDADVNARCRGGFTPLHLAVKLNRIAIFSLLHNVYQADCNVLDWYGKKPLDYCVNYSPEDFLNYERQVRSIALDYCSKDKQNNELEMVVIGKPAIKCSESGERSWYSMDNLETITEDGIPFPPPNTPRLVDEQQLNFGGISDAVIATLKNLQEKPDKRVLKKSASMDNLQNSLPIETHF